MNIHGGSPLIALADGNPILTNDIFYSHVYVG